MSVGEILISARTRHTDETRDGETTWEQDGMTYRQWLIGQALANPKIVSDFASGGLRVAREAIEAADCVIAQLALQGLATANDFESQARSVGVSSPAELGELLHELREEIINGSIRMSDDAAFPLIRQARNAGLASEEELRRRACHGACDHESCAMAREESP